MWREHIYWAHNTSKSTEKKTISQRQVHNSICITGIHYGEMWVVLWLWILLCITNMLVLRFWSTILGLNNFLWQAVFARYCHGHFVGHGLFSSYQRLPRSVNVCISRDIFSALGLLMFSLTPQKCRSSIIVDVTFSIHHG